MAKSGSGYNHEVEMVGTYAGGVLGGLSVGVFGDLLNTELNTMVFYIAGACLGAFAGLIAGTIFRRMIWQSGGPDADVEVSARRV
jgi:hypothetical protein